MAHVTVTLLGRTYRFGCEAGEEARIQALADDLARRVDAIRKQFGQVGDDRIMAMAALLVTDELFDLRDRLAALERGPEPAPRRSSGRAVRAAGAKPAAGPPVPPQGAEASAGIEPDAGAPAGPSAESEP